MSESQRKIIGFMVVAGFCSVLQVAALSATLTDSVSSGCPPDADCALPTRTLRVFASEYDGSMIFRTQFDYYRTNLIILTVLAEIMCMYVIIKTVREREMERKTPTIGGV